MDMKSLTNGKIDAIKSELDKWLKSILDEPSLRGCSKYISNAFKFNERTSSDFNFGFAVAFN